MGVPGVPCLQGCTLALMLCAAKPEYNTKFSVLAHMGPVTFVDFFRAPFLRFSATNYLDLVSKGVTAVPTGVGCT